LIGRIWGFTVGSHKAFLFRVSVFKYDRVGDATQTSQGATMPSLSQTVSIIKDFAIVLNLFKHHQMTSRMRNLNDKGEKEDDNKLQKKVSTNVNKFQNIPRTSCILTCHFEDDQRSRNRLLFSRSNANAFQGRTTREKKSSSFLDFDGILQLKEKY
jgi:hypothetical protein